MLVLIRHGGFPKAQLEPGRQLFRLRKIRFGTRGKRFAGKRSYPLIWRHTFTLIDHYSKIAFADLIKRRTIGDAIRVIAGIGTDTRRLTFL